MKVTWTRATTACALAALTLACSGEKPAPASTAPAVPPATSSPAAALTAPAMAAPVPAAAGAIPQPSASAAIPTPPDDQTVRRIIADYERAVETRDIGLYKRLWPTLSPAQEKALTDAFRHASKHDVQIRLLGPVEMSGQEATLRLQRTDVEGGKPIIRPFNMTVTLVRQGDSWTIKSIGM